MGIVRYYLLENLDVAKKETLLQRLQKVEKSVCDVHLEKCYHVETAKGVKVSETQEKILRWLLKHSQEEDALTGVTTLLNPTSNSVLIEIGPRFNFSTADSTNSVSICESVGFEGIVKRIEVSMRYLIVAQNAGVDKKVADFVELLGDRMTQCQYTEKNLPVEDFYEQVLLKKPENWYRVPVLEQGIAALRDVNAKLGLAFDEWDLQYYSNLFGNVLKRNPTSVELFDCAQSNSEHSRHWFFKGKMKIDGEFVDKSLIKLIVDTQETTNPNNTIKFSDNSSAIKGFKQKALRPTQFSGPGKVEVVNMESDLIFTAETHNMPTAVAPFSGATTGTGGRIRDVQGVGRGGLTIAGTAGYCVGALHIPDSEAPYEDDSWRYPPTFSSPLKIIIDASNGASDYGNKFGEPVISGFAISYGIRDSAGERCEYVKPIMFSGGLGTMDATHTDKFNPEKRNLLAKLGGPVYRIGVGGGAASSVEVQGGRDAAELDFNAVQRGDAEMENKLNRVVRACIEMGAKNPILAIHDQGAGGNGNVLKELVEPGYAGAVIFSKEFQLGDPTITALELWGAEYQENNAILCRQEDRQLLEDICSRERCPINFVGVVTGNGYVTLLEEEANFEKYLERQYLPKETARPFDLHLKDVLGEMPRKEFTLDRLPRKLTPLQVPEINLEKTLKTVLGIMAVGSKRFLTNKVDRCVTGLIAQQQCVGSLHTPLADFAVTAVSYFGHEGIATSIGTQPIKGLISPQAGARMSVAEALSNLVFVGISELADVKCSGNWMWAAKLPGEGLKLYEACQAMCSFMKELNIAVDGGKDSLSMAARVGGETVKSPGTLVISTYVQCPDIRVKVTPDLKMPSRGGRGELVFVSVENKFRLGASALAQALGQQGDDCPDVQRADVLKRAFEATQKLLKKGKLLAGHDVSDGGLLVCVLEMAFGGMCGLNVDISSIFKGHSHSNYIPILFAEECGWVLEVESQHFTEVIQTFASEDVPVFHIGSSLGSGIKSPVRIQCQGKVLLDVELLQLFKQWEATSFALEKLQMNEECAKEEFESLSRRKVLKYSCTYNPDEVILPREPAAAIRVAVIREEGTNGDREMISSLYAAKFEVHDVAMTDLLAKKVTLDAYRGVVFPGGFSYADTLGSAKGWAATILFSDVLRPQFDQFRRRKDTFSLGVCNGCQLMSLIGWVGNPRETKESAFDVPDVALLHNRSERYECRWSTVRIAHDTNSVLLKRMRGSVMGCWIAHGEGRFSFRTRAVLEGLKSRQSVAMHYVDDDHKPTEVYPMNPNGSTEGVAGITSEDGRHLALMPHPERCSILWQWPYVPHDFKHKNSPWQTMFDEAFLWCSSN
ncbi:phosphoribosylformylglycinamidine synthase [Phlebotomus argentipes]|uniref:phosphoribosylformylglycinamidine synthase n=1 Tax=Phlebotomus argentipes TaxID=94469 RepID=UPI002892C6C0|nr:phosphoribosylformylglycinamidine synthase [Phlebotomus argentipes]